MDITDIAMTGSGAGGLYLLVRAAERLLMAALEKRKNGGKSSNSCPTEIALQLERAGNAIERGAELTDRIYDKIIKMDSKIDLVLDRTRR